MGTRAIKSPKSSPSTATQSTAAPDEGKPATSTGGPASVQTPTITSFGSLRGEKKQSSLQYSGSGPTMERKFILGREGSSAFSSPSNTASAQSALSAAPATPKHGGGGLLGEKKHFSSSTLTPAQNKLLSKEALSIKSIFESTANRMDEKISDVYEFEDEYDDQDTGSGALGGVGSASGTASGGATVPRKLVSDVPPAEVVSSLSLTPSSASSTATDEKRKKPLQRKSMAASWGSSASTGGASSNVKQEKHPASSRKEDGGPPNSGSGGGGGGGGSSGNGSGPGSGGGRSISPGSAVSGGTVPDFPIEVGDKLKVYYDEQKVTYEAKVIEIAKQEGNPIYLVHYTGWNTR